MAYEMLRQALGQRIAQDRKEESPLYKAQVNFQNLQSKTLQEKLAAYEDAKKEKQANELFKSQLNGLVQMGRNPDLKVSDFGSLSKIEQKMYDEHGESAKEMIFLHRNAPPELKQWIITNKETAPYAKVFWPELAESKDSYNVEGRKAVAKANADQQMRVIEAQGKKEIEAIREQGYQKSALEAEKNLNKTLFSLQKGKIDLAKQQYSALLKSWLNSELTPDKLIKLTMNQQQIVDTIYDSMDKSKFFWQTDEDAEKFKKTADGLIKEGNMQGLYNLITGTTKQEKPPTPPELPKPPEKEDNRPTTEKVNSSIGNFAADVFSSHGSIFKENPGLDKGKDGELSYNGKPLLIKGKKIKYEIFKSMSYKDQQKYLKFLGVINAK